MYLTDVGAMKLIASAWHLAMVAALTPGTTQRERRWAEARASAFVEAATAVLAEQDWARGSRSMPVRLRPQDEVIEKLKSYAGDPATKIRTAPWTMERPSEQP